MAALTLDKFGGMDLRRNQKMAASNVMFTLNNAYITSGMRIKKRPCLTKVATLEAGTVGLFSGLGKLNTFFGGGSFITHANTLFQAHRVYHSTDKALTLSDAHFCTPFNGYLYVAVEYSNGDVKHAYLNDDGAWQDSHAYVAGQFVRPTTPNGFRYKCLANGTSGTVEPTWSTTLGADTADVGFDWRCFAMTIEDTNCPNTTIVRKLGQKIYCAGAGVNSGNVSFCAAAAPRDWTTASDAGFLPAGINAAGSSEVTALGDFGGDIGVFFSDSMQVWDVDADPSKNALKSAKENVGTVHKKTPAALANDLVFLAQQGFRSVSLIAITDNLQENDVGSAIDPIRDEIAATDSPISIYYPRLGQLWTINGQQVYVYAFSKSVKLSAWQKFTLPITVDHAAVLNGELYLRSGNDVYVVDENATNDDGAIPTVTIEFFYQDAKSPGVLKLFVGFDLVVVGEPSIAFRLQDENDVEVVTQPYAVSGDMRAGVMHPMELTATQLAPIITHHADEDFAVDSMMIYFEPLGPV